MSNVATFASRVVASELTIDFLRLTTPIDDKTTDWLRPIRHEQENLRLQGHKLNAYQLSDMKGTIVGGAGWLKNETHALAEARGGCAERIYPFYTEKAGKATRIDLALTVWFESYDHAVAHDIHQKATRHLIESGLAERRRMPTLWGGIDGWTCYLGSRKSDTFFRVYDKDKQSGEQMFKNAWRFELECKGQHAANLWERLRVPETRPFIIQSEIVHFLEKQGIALKGFNATFGATKVGSAQTPADVKRKLEWLYNQVRPTVTDLIARGFLNDVLLNLDLPSENLHILE